MKFPIRFAVLVLILSACGTPASAAIPDIAVAAVKIDPLPTEALIPTVTSTESPVFTQPGVHILLNVYPPDGEYTFIRLTLSSTTSEPLGSVFVYVVINGIQVNGEKHETWGHPCSDTAIAELACDVKVTNFQSFSAKVTREGKSCTLDFNVPLSVSGDTFIENQLCEFED